MSPYMIPIVGTICLFGLPIVAIICGTIVKLKSQQASDSPEQTRMMQEIHQSLSRMEQRIEALETILFDQSPGGTES